MAFEIGRTLGRTGLAVSRIGLAPGGGGLSGAEVERAFERGVNYLYWGSMRAKPFGEGIRAVAGHHRERLVLVVQSYTRVASLLKLSLTRALKALRTDYTDLLLLGWWNRLPPRRLLDAALALREAGLARHLIISCHDRTMFKAYAEHQAFGAVMVRYNASHPGAEREVFPVLGENRPGVVTYTATRWGGLIDPKLAPAGERVPTTTDCYRFALTQPAVDVCTTAPQNAAQLDQALATLDAGPMSEDELAWMKRVGAHVKSQTASARRFGPISLADRLEGFFTGRGDVQRW